MVLRVPDPENALVIQGLTTDNFFFTELLTAEEAAALAVESLDDECRPDDCPCVFKYPHLSPNHKHQSCLPCPCDVDEELPEVFPPEPKTVECTEKGGTSRFATCIDPDSGLCIEDWLDSVICADRPIDEPDKIKTCTAFGPPSFFDAGCNSKPTTEPPRETEVTFLAEDSCCNENTAVSSIFVQDTLPPVITPGSDDLYCVWPANHEYVCFDRSQFDPEIEDLCHDYTWKFTGCVSIQPDNASGDGNTTNDCQVTCDGEVICVRAERNNDPNGRRYPVEIQATDECQNIGDEPVVIGFIHVPHSSLPGCVAPPEIDARCSAAPTSGDVPLLVDFTDDSTSTGPVINSWLWEFGDASTSTEQNPAHDYTVPGVYIPTLMVSTDPPGGCNPSAGLSGFTTCPEIDVALPDPVCTATPTSGEAPLDVAFTGQSSIAGVTWQWDFGDGNTSMVQNPAYTYTNPGTFNPTVTISLNGQTASAACPEIDVTPPGLDCDLSEWTAPPGGGKKLITVPIDVTDSNGAPAPITIVSIFQDEPVTGRGSGQTCPDGVIATTTTPNDTARVIPEFQGSGDGRVYHINFTAAGNDGSTCSSGKITACIRHGRNNPCVDGGPLYDSTVCP